MGQTFKTYTMDFNPPEVKTYSEQHQPEVLKFSECVSCLSESLRNFGRGIDSDVKTFEMEGRVINVLIGTYNEYIDERKFDPERFKKALECLKEIHEGKLRDIDLHETNLKLFVDTLGALKYAQQNA